MRPPNPRELASLDTLVRLDQASLALLPYHKHRFVWYVEWARMKAVGLGPNLGRSRLFASPIFESVEAAETWALDPANVVKVQRSILARGEGSSVPTYGDPRPAVRTGMLNRDGTVARVTGA